MPSNTFELKSLVKICQATEKLTSLMNVRLLTPTLFLATTALDLSLQVSNTWTHLFKVPTFGPISSRFQHLDPSLQGSNIWTHLFKVPTSGPISSRLAYILTPPTLRPISSRLAYKLTLPTLRPISSRLAYKLTLPHLDPSLQGLHTN